MESWRKSLGAGINQAEDPWEVRGRNHTPEDVWEVRDRLLRGSQGKSLGGGINQAPGTGPVGGEREVRDRLLRGSRGRCCADFFKDSESDVRESEEVRGR